MSSLPIHQYLPLTQIEEDPLNSEAFSLQEIHQLAEDMQQDGFFGEITVYPINSVEPVRYRIESGHRRFRAAQEAGLTQVPVEITDPPANMIERRLRLTQWNLHGRNYTPVDVAKLVCFTYDTYAMMKKQGQASGSLLELTAQELDISTSNVSKYKMLLSLIPELQALVEQGQYSWAIMASASQLPEPSQRLLYRNIIAEAKIHPITGNWLSREIEEYKHMRLSSREKYVYRPQTHTPQEKIEQEEVRHSARAKAKSLAGTRYRRRDGKKALHHAYEMLDIACNTDAILREGDREEICAMLTSMRRMIEDALEMLQDE